jgi:hypothetical protein
MLRKICFCMLWFLIIYIVACLIVGGVAGAVAGNADPANAYSAGQVAGAAAVSSIRIYIFFVACLAAIIGTVNEVLPGTKKKSGSKNVT